MDKLFASFRRDLISAGTFELVETHFNRARRINFVLEPEPRRWSEIDLQTMLRETGFSGIEKEVPFYQGQGKIVFTHRS